MTRPDISMTVGEARAFLEGGRKLHVATLRSDGSPHLTTLWYVMSEGCITFRSFTKSQRIVNLQRDPRITALVEEGDTYNTLRGVMVKGRARLINDRAIVLEVYGRVAVKYEGGGMGGAMDTDALEMLFGRHADRNTVVRIEPAEVVSWDHRKLGGGY
jgi:PPOX class probable F420-dependent enzyme